MIYRSCRRAVIDANAVAPRIVGWVQSLSGWVIYPPNHPVTNAEPELLCVAQGRLPIALSDRGKETLEQLLEDTRCLEPSLNLRPYHFL